MRFGSYYNIEAIIRANLYIACLHILTNCKWENGQPGLRGKCARIAKTARFLLVTRGGWGISIPHSATKEPGL